jgi:hypothetical protein
MVLGWVGGWVGGDFMGGWVVLPSALTQSGSSEKIGDGVRIDWTFHLFCTPLHARKVPCCDVNFCLQARRRRRRALTPA